MSLTNVPQRSFLLKAHGILAAMGGVYVLAVGLLAIPYFQSHTLYMNALKFPLFANFASPETYGLSPNKTLNFKIETPDNEQLGAWFIFSDPFYHSLPSPPSAPAQYVTKALENYPTILFLHGNAATRAFSARIQHYSAFTSRLSANVLAVDYRGFADSTGTPSEEGLVRDARAAWEWLISHGAKGEDILIVGHSLGTGVGGRLAAELSEDGVKYRGVVLMSPFSSIGELLKTYNLFGVVPLMKPLAMIPYATNFVSWALIHRFDTLSIISKIKGPVLIAHAENDWDIPYTHSEVLFNALLEPHLPSVDLPSNPASLSKDEWAAFTARLSARKEKRAERVVKTSLENFGSIEEFDDDGRQVTFVKTLAGKHDFIGTQEGLQDIIGRRFELIV